MGIRSVTAGNKAQDQFKKYMKKKRAFVHKLPDSGDIPTVGGKRVMLPAQPADYVVCSPSGVIHYAEVKSSANRTVFPLQMIRESQRAGAKECVRTKCPYYFYVYSQYNNLWYCVPGGYVVDCLRKGDKSIPWKDLDTYILKW